MNRRLSTLLLALVLMAASGAPLRAQSLDARIKHAMDRLNESSQEEDAPRGPTIAQKLGNVIDQVNIAAPARKAFEWWSKTTGINLLINWDAMTSHGIDPEKPITLNLRGVPAGAVLGLLMQQAATDQESLIFETTPWYIQVMTKSEANKYNVIRVYDITDLLFQVQDFDAPANPALTVGQPVTAGGPAGSTPTPAAPAASSSTTPFYNSSSSTQTNTATAAADSAKSIIDLIHKMIEPSVWDVNGGTASIVYQNRKLIVSAPLYVQRQISRSGAGMGSSGPMGMVHSPAAPASGAKSAASTPPSKPGDVSGVSPTPSEPVSGVQH